MLQCKRQTGYNQPDDIQKERTSSATILHLFSKGKKLSAANLKHCIPTGIPTTVIHQRQPARHQLSPLTAPPNTNHNTFPRHPICYTSPFIRFFTSASIFSIRLMASSTCSLASAIFNNL